MIGSDHGIRSIDLEAPTRNITPGDVHLQNFASNWPHYRDNLVVFLGAGASVGARNVHGQPLPSAIHLKDALWDAFVAHGDATALAAAKYLALDHATALIERSAGRKALTNFLVQAFTTEAPLWQHLALAFLKPAALFTTNYDQLIEQAWRIHGGRGDVRPLRVYYRDEDPDADQSVPLYKPHGTVERAGKAVLEGGLVITQFDYIAVLNDRRKALERVLTALGDACVLFVGYSFQDLDIAAVLHGLRNGKSGGRAVPWYAVFPRNDENVRGMYDQQYGIRQINRTFRDFMADLDDLVDFLPAEWKFKSLHPTASTESVAKEMS